MTNRPQTLDEGICVLVDGGCRNNQKPVSDRVMYGSLTAFRNGEQIETTSSIAGDGKRLIHSYSIPAICDHASNNLAEVVMLRRALEYIWDLVLRTESLQCKSKLDAVTIMSDSEWALGIITGAYKLKAKNDTAYHNDLTSIQHCLAQLEKHNVKVIFQHVNNLWVKEILGH